MSSATVERVGLKRDVSISRKQQRRIFILSLVLIDTTALLISFTIAYVLRFKTNLPFFEETAPSLIIHVYLSAIIIPICLIIFWLFQLYNIHYLLGGTEEYSRIFNACAVLVAVVLVGAFLIPLVRLSRGWLAVAVISIFLLVSISRFAMRRVAYGLRRRGFLTWRTLIVGTNDEARAIALQLIAAPTAGAELCGFVDDHNPVGSRIEGRLAVVGPIDAIPTLLPGMDVEELIVSTSALDRPELIKIFQAFGQSPDIQLRFSSGLFEIFTTGVHVKEIGSVPLVSMNKLRLKGIETLLKTITDYGITSILLILLSPLLLTIAILIKLDSPGPILHRRNVLGRGDRVFDAFKFRTMHENAEAMLAQHPELALQFQKNYKLKQDPRITRVGRFLRRYSLDELPQFLNILKGQMSLVGPRMITPAEASKYGKWRMNLLTVKPGLTGLWQVSGRSDVTYDERVRLDMYYIRNYTIWLDLQILWETIPAVLRGRGAY